MEKPSAKNIEAAIFSAIDRLTELLPPNVQLERTRTAPLLAEGSSLDSMAVVNLLVFVEEEIHSALGIDIMLTGVDSEAGVDAEALETVGTLIDALCARVSQ